METIAATAEDTTDRQQRTGTAGIGTTTAGPPQETATVGLLLETATVALLQTTATQSLQLRAGTAAHRRKIGMEALPLATATVALPLAIATVALPLATAMAHPQEIGMTALLVMALLVTDAMVALPEETVMMALLHTTGTRSGGLPPAMHRAAAMACWMGSNRRAIGSLTFI